VKSFRIFLLFLLFSSFCFNLKTGPLKQDSIKIDTFEKPINLKTESGSFKTLQECAKEIVSLQYKIGVEFHFKNKYFYFYDLGDPYFPFVKNQALNQIDSISFSKLSNSVIGFKDGKNHSLEKIKAWKDSLFCYACVYKIHLMPKNKEDISKILEILLSDQQFVDSFYALKFWATRCNGYPEKDSLGNNFPIIVIYPKVISRNKFTFMDQLKPTDFTECKQNAQNCLNRVVKLTKQFEGLKGFTPRFNSKVSDLIYVAQGNADDKYALINDKECKEKNINLDEVFNKKRNWAYLNNVIYGVKIAEPGKFELVYPKDGMLDKVWNWCMNYLQ